MTCLKAALPLLVLALAGAAAAAAPKMPVVTTLTLEDARRLALENHPLLQKQRFNAEAALQEIAAARSAWFPQVSGYIDRVFAPNNTRIGATPGLTDPTVIDRASTGFGVSQMITDFGRTDDQIEQAKFLAEEQSLRTAQTGQAVLLDVTRAYYQVLRSQSLLRVARKTLEDRATILKRVTAMQAARLRSELDVRIAEQFVDQGNLFVLSAKGDRDAGMAHLAAALGFDSVTQFVLADAEDDFPMPPAAEGLVQEMLRQSPELAAQVAARGAAEKGAEAAGEAYSPTIAALGAIGYNPVPEPSQRVRDSYFAGGVSLSVPILTGGLLEANEAKAKAEASAADRVVADTRNRLSSEVRVAYASVRTAYDRIAVTDHLVVTARQSLNLMQTGFDLGRNSIVDLSQAELQATEAEIAHADARYTYLSKLAALQFVVGELSVVVEKP